MLFVPGSPVGSGGAGKYASSIAIAGTPSLTVWGVTQVSGAGVDTLSAGFTDLIAAANMTFDVGFLELWVGATVAPAAADSSTLLNLYVGAAGAEVALITGLSIGWCGPTDTKPRLITFPCFIPQGTRLSMKTQSITASRSFEIAATLYPADQGRAGSMQRGPTKFEVLGSNLTGSRGTSHTPGNTGAFSTAANIGATTSFDAKYIALMASGQGVKSDVTMTNIAYIVELSKSGGPVYGSWYVVGTTAETQICVPSGMLPCVIPSGTQLQIRAKASGTAEAQDYSVCLAG